MSGNRAMRRAEKMNPSTLERLIEGLPLLTDETKRFTPDEAQLWLDTKNKHNRPMNLVQARKYADMMDAGTFKLHGQGIMLDKDGMLITGQTRLQAIVLYGKPVYLRVSYGNERDIGHLIDRGRPQSSRDLATRKTHKKHKPAEASIARALCALDGKLRPSPDDVAVVIANHYNVVQALLEKTQGTDKTKAVLMILAVLAGSSTSVPDTLRFVSQIDRYADKLEEALATVKMKADKCWNKGSAFIMAMETARKVVNGRV